MMAKLKFHFSLQLAIYLLVIKNLSTTAIQSSSSLETTFNKNNNDQIKIKNDLLSKIVVLKSKYMIKFNFVVVYFIVYLN